MEYRARSSKSGWSACGSETSVALAEEKVTFHRSLTLHHWRLRLPSPLPWRRRSTCGQRVWGRALTLSLWSKSTELETDVRRSYRS